MQHVSAASLTSLPERITYLSSFLDLGPSDTEALLASAPLIAPLVPAVLDAVYTKLLSFDITAQAFVPKNTDYEGDIVKSVQELTMDHPQIALRKDFLKVRFHILDIVNLVLIPIPDLLGEARHDEGSESGQQVLGLPQQCGHNAHRTPGVQTPGETSGFAGRIYTHGSPPWICSRYRGWCCDGHG